MTELNFLEGPELTLVSHNLSDEMVAMAAWVSQSADREEKLNDRKRIEGLINFLYREKHLSPFEHGSMTLKVRVPIFVAREWHRHRTQSFNEMSGRYTELKPDFYIPNETRAMIQEGKVGNYTFLTDTELALVVQDEFIDAYHEDWARYQRLLRLGVAKEVARITLPLGIYTEYYATANARNWMQFLTLRNDENAQKEIRDAAEQVQAILTNLMPLTMAAYERYDWRNAEQAPQTVEDIIEKLVINFVDTLMGEKK